MIISDLIIISFDKKIPTRHLRSKFTFERYNRNFAMTPKLYKDAFPFIQAFRGFWYRIYPPPKDIYSNTFFDMKLGPDGIPCVIVREEWVDSISFLLGHFLHFETGLHCGVLVRLEGTKNDVIHTGYTSEMFFAELLHGNIHFDELYLLG